MPFTNPRRRSTCPYCFEQFHLSDCSIVTTNQQTNYTIWNPPPHQRLKKAWSRWSIPAISGRKMAQVMARRKCPNPDCGRILPYNIDYMDSYVIALVGGSTSGKTHYIASLIQQLQSRAEILEGIQCTWFAAAGIDIDENFENNYFKPLFIDHRRLSRTNQGTLPEPLIYEMIFQGHPRVLPFTLPGQSKPMFEIVLYPRGYKQLSSQHQSPPSGAFRLKLTLPWWRPSKRANLVLHDAAGDDLEDPASLVQFDRYVLHASALIFLADPEGMPNVIAQLPYHLRKQGSVTSKPSTILNRIIQTIQMDRGLQIGESLSLPIAITLSKADLFQFFGGVQQKFAFTIEPEYQYGFDNRDFNQVSAEVEELIRQSGDRALLSAINTFTTVGFCAVSATGESPDPTDPSHYININPVRCPDPLLWILWQLGVIRSR